MVTFNKGSFTIEVKTGAHPVEDWLELQKELLFLVQSLDQSDTPESPWRTMALIKEMLPDLKTANLLYTAK